jgi:TatD DNase family protein
VRLVDIGVNLTSKQFRADLDPVIERARAAGVDGMVVTGTSVDASAAAADLADREPGLWSTAGIHQHQASTWNPEAAAALRALAARPRVVAVGECGLDFNRNFSPPSAQLDCFAAQLDLACELGMPVFVHERDASAALIEVLRPRRERLPRACVHCFTGTAAELDDYLALDLHIGITGWICDERRGLHLRELIRRIPEDRLMIETDAPYLLPRSMPDPPANRRNEPAFLVHVLAAVAAALGRPADEVAAATTQTACRFFDLVPAMGDAR